MSEASLDIGQPLSESELCPGDLLQGQEEAFARDVERLLTRRNEFVAVSCPACNTDEGSPCFEKFGFRYVRCPDCATIYMSPRPAEHVMADYYSNSENYQFWAEHIFPASEASRREKIHKPWFERVLGYASQFDVARDLLVEVGPGFGTFASVAVESGQFERVVAIEPTPELAAACRERGVEVIERRVEAVADEIDGADIVCSFETIEHLFEPVTFLRQCSRLLKPGGLLVLSCPNGMGFDIATLGPESLAVDPEHVNLFNPDSLARLVGRSGFSVADVATPGRLDAEFVRTAALEGRCDLSAQPLLRKVLIEDWDRLGWAFQEFLAQNGLSSHMWLAAIRTSA